MEPDRTYCSIYMEIHKQCGQFRVRVHSTGFPDNDGPALHLIQEQDLSVFCSHLEGLWRGLGRDMAEKMKNEGLKLLEYSRFD